MKEVKFYDAVIKNGIGVNLESFNREELIDNICNEFKTKGFTCLKFSNRKSLDVNGIKIIKEKRKIADVSFDKYGVYFSSGFPSEMVEPIKILSFYLADATFN